MVMKMRAICLSCGGPKPLFSAACMRCRFVPLSLTDKAKSLMLSTAFQVQTNEFGNEDLSKSWHELVEIGESIAAGRQYDFPLEQLHLAEQQVRFIETLKPRDVLRVAALWLLPILLLVGLAMILVIFG